MVDGNDIIITVIIPIYNSERYLSRTIDSVINSGIQCVPYEILLVDDGSTDSSPYICDRYRERYSSTIRVIHQDNKGISASRNIGITTARGLFLWFVDSDDYVREGSIDYFINQFFDPNYEVIGFSSDTLVNDSGLLLSNSANNSVVVYRGGGISYLEQCIPTFIWVYWFRRSFILHNNLFFEDAQNMEDTLYNLNIFLKNPKCLITNLKVYCYINYLEDNHQVTKNRTPEMSRKIVGAYINYFIILAQSDSLLSDIAISRMSTSQMVPFVSRALSSNLSTNEWKSIVSLLRSLELIPIKAKGLITKTVSIVLSTPFLFRFWSFLYRKLFVSIILPRMSRA